MTTNDILTTISEEQPEMMAKIAGHLEAIDKECPDFMPGVMKDFDIICSMTSEKVAASTGKAVKSALKAARFGPMAIAVGGTLAGGLLSSISTDLYDAAKRGLTKGRNFDRIMDANPNLKRELDRKQMLMAFDALHRYAPDFTADPLIGGALLKQVAELPQMSHKTIIELIGARKDLLDAKGRHFNDISKLAPRLIPDAPHTERTYKFGDKEGKGKRVRLDSVKNTRPGE